ncbi:MAG: fructosamine kinase family protein [Usitatibacter sp.]
MNATPAAAAVAQAISEATGTRFTATAEEPVSGGCIHTAIKLSGKTANGAPHYFVKVNEADRAPMFAAEADGIAALRSAGAVSVPTVVTHGEDGEHAWLVLEWLDLVPLDTASGAKLGNALARQHCLAQAKFGWASDNFIGASAQANGWSDDWLAFWREKRLHAQLRLAARKRLPTRLIDRGERRMADCAAFFSNYQPAKSLLHGDLWGGNAAALADGTPVTFDPAAYVGDREADVAMTELFGGFPKDFHAAYRAAWPLDDGYRVRRDFYNLYHVLNHANLFAGAYVRQAEQSIERLLAEIR